MKLLAPLASLILAMLSLPAISAEFTTGPLIETYGPNAAVKQTVPLSGKESFKIAFDAVDKGPEDKPNSQLQSLARFLNMHARAGLDPENLQLALVVHGKATQDLLNETHYRGKFERANPNSELIDALLENKVRIIVCGQSAAYQGIENEQLHPGVEVALSAMTAHALLQQQGYTLNP